MATEIGKFITEAKFHEAVMRAGLLGMVRLWLSISGEPDAESMRKRARDLLRTLIDVTGREEFIRSVKEADAHSGLKTDLTGLI